MDSSNETTLATSLRKTSMAGDDDNDAENDTSDTNHIEASWTWSQFAQYARLCADPALLGKALLHELEGGCGGAAAEVALLVAAHRCLTLAADAEGAAALLSHVREQAYVVCLDFITIIIFIIIYNYSYCYSQLFV